MITLTTKNRIDNSAVLNSLTRITGQVFKLLPVREEGTEWGKPLQTLIVEVSGISALFADIDLRNKAYHLLCELKALQTLTEKDDFAIYRKTIFECLGIIEELKKLCQD